MIPIDGETEDLIFPIAEKIESEFDENEIPVPVKKINRFILDCAASIIHQCPESVREAFEVGLEFCENNATEAELNTERSKCWAYLKKHDAHLDVKKKKNCQIKAVICGLGSSIESYHVYDTFEFAVAMLQRSGVSTHDIQEAFKKHFIY